MQREHGRRGFIVSHQKVVVDIDFSGALRGYTEITIVPTSKDLKTLYFHSRQCHIHSVTVGGYIAEFIHQDPLSMLSASDITDCHRHPELKRKLYSALAEGNEGELGIAMPSQVTVRSAGHTTNGVLPSEAATPEPQTPGASQAQQLALEFSPIVVNIEYSLRNPADGLEFVLPTDAYPYRVPHMYTTPSSLDAARCWVPCVDNLWERCTWEFEFVVPKYLAEPEHDSIEFDGEDAAGEGSSNPTVVVCSGELVEQVAHPNNSNKTIFLFSQAIPTSVQHIAFAAGPFHVFPIPTEGVGLAEDTPAVQTLMHAFCLPGQESSLSTSVSFLRGAMNFYSAEFGSYPFGSHKLVFVDELPTQRFDSATLSLVSVDLLHGDDAIDQVFETRQILSHALACQWVGINILPKQWSDTWLINGLGLYISGLFMRKLLGHNEYRFRLKKDMERVLERDNGSMPPICQPTNLEPPDSSFLPFINVKAPLILHILDRRLGKSGTSLGLSRVLPKVFLSAISGEMQNNALSTHTFLRTCRKVSGVDLRSFVDQWIFGSGCPHFSFSANFNRKKMAVEIQMRQECPALIAHEGNPVALALFKPASFFEGQMTVRIHEADGTPYEHVLDILSPTKRFEVPFNTKYKRVRRNTKRYLARQAAAQAAAEGDTEAAEAIGMIDMGFGLEVWENEDERERWKVSDWTEEEESAMAGATYEWIRIDADFEWIAHVQFEQADFMWVSQLQRDRDVVAQLEAVRALSKSPTPIVSSTLTKTVLVTNYYFRIRSEAAIALVSCATRRLDFIGLFHLFKLFLRYCYDPEDPEQDLFLHKYVPRPNDFSDLPEYFVRKSLLCAISQVRFENGKSPPIIRQFFIDQLRYNDNTSNHFSDAYFICATVSALGCSTISTAAPERGELLRTDIRLEQTPEDVNLMQAAVAEIERYRNMDRLIPSANNVVTVACLEFYLLLIMGNLLPSDPRMFLLSTREGNATQVRMAGFDGLFLMKWYTPRIMPYIFAVMANDSSRIIRRHVARNTCESLALLVSVGEIKHASKESEALLIEEDGSTPDKAKEQKKSEVDLVIRSLRKDKEVGKNDALRDSIMPVLLDPKADSEVRWCLLKLAEMVIRGAEEPKPKLTIHVPATPVSETPPSLPTPVATSRPAQGRPIKIVNRKASLLPSTPGAVPSKVRFPPKTAVAPPPVASPVVTVKHATVRPPRPVPVPKKKEKPLPKAQSGGISVNDLKACRNALKKLVANKHSLLFRQPVDPVRDRAPNYFEVIKNPMDLSTMGVKLEEGLYKDRNAFQADFRLMLKNCQTYNAAGTYAFNESLAIDTFFEKLWTMTIKTLEVKDKATQQAASMEAPPAPVALPKPRPVTPAPPPVRASAPLKPSIKIKLGLSHPVHVAEAPKQSAKAKQTRPRKPKATDVASSSVLPPPEIDDGSNDLLEEILAIEREKGEETRGSTSSKPLSAKRQETVNEVNEMDEDEEILNLAGVVASTSHSEPPPALPSPVPQPASRPKSSIPPQAKSVTEENAPEPSPTVKKKGKDPVREVVTLSKPKKPLPRPQAESSPAPQLPSVVSSTPINDKKCREVLKNLLKIPQAGIFSRPVDPELDGCPTYYQEIKNPMDFATMRSRLDKGEYSTMEEFQKDVELIFSNCRLFNPPGTDPTLCADIVEKAFAKEWAKAIEKKLSFQEKRSLLSIMTKCQTDLTYEVFREPVDPVALKIPMYHHLIPKKDARDLRTIRSKLDTDKYLTVEAWEADMELMINNAIKFNGLESGVGQISLSLRARVKEHLSNLRGNQNQGKKRQAQGAADTTNKKVKLG